MKFLRNDSMDTAKAEWIQPQRRGYIDHWKFGDTQSYLSMCQCKLEFSMCSFHIWCKDGICLNFIRIFTDLDIRKKQIDRILWRIENQINGHTKNEKKILYTRLHCASFVRSPQRKHQIFLSYKSKRSHKNRTKIQ